MEEGSKFSCQDWMNTQQGREEQRAWLVSREAGRDVIHTVGPIARGHISDSHKEDLAKCYKASLKLAKENLIRSIALLIMDYINVSLQVRPKTEQENP
ncbi:hypothetical protein JRQ81_005949 [Phrynocephalus forsythii]|uniref:Macro domain-containing protein n=1 Tax=Phrynocephalus forsythii TaxID=171643 RepID=A0A9Q0Y3A9_9SAUR|nr:hypothetical protein JRQ81_005949 [Phrynocephalus forsythii]